jgi:hypothetical protein
MSRRQTNKTPSRKNQINNKQGTHSKALLPDPLTVQAMNDIGEDLGKGKAGTTINNLLDEIMGP